MKARCLKTIKRISAAEYFSLTPALRIFWLKVVLCLAFLAGLLLSIKLWLTSRSYPLSPVFEALPAVPFPFDYFLFVALLVLLILIIILARPRRWIVTFIILAGLLSLWDQSRWQPWFYQYTLMFAAMSFYSWGQPNVEEQEALLNTCRLIVIAIYFWSGIQKINFSFLHEIFPPLINPFLHLIFRVKIAFPALLSIVVPVSEISIGIGLLTRKFRRISVLLALITHASILLLFIPFRRNDVVWPWNMAMASFVFILFWQTKVLSFKDILLAPKNHAHKIAVALFVVMPLFSFFNLWDSYLSSSLYSGNVAQAIIIMSEPVKNRLPAGVQHYCLRSSDGREVLIINKWSYEELNVPSYPEPRVFKNIARQICGYAENPSEVILKIYEKPNWLSGFREQRSVCLRRSGAR